MCHTVAGQRVCAARWAGGGRIPNAGPVVGTGAGKRSDDSRAPVLRRCCPSVLASLGAMINGRSAVLLTSVRHHGGSLSRAAFLSARNDVLVNVAIIGMGVVTTWTRSGCLPTVHGWSRVYPGIHHVSDVVWGALDGLTCGLIAWLFLPRNPIDPTDRAPDQVWARWARLNR